jgi:DNA repair protein RecO (recombination protein O)
MSKILKDKGVVLKRRNYRETSKLISIFSENHGKINLIAKGVRTPKSKLSAVLEPMNFIEFVYYKKVTRDLQFLSSADIINDFQRIKSDFGKIQTAFALLELTNIFVHEDESNQSLFQKLIESLIALNNLSLQSKIFLVYYIVHLMDLGGYPIVHSICPSCNKNLLQKENQKYFSKHFGLICASCSKSNRDSVTLNFHQNELIVKCKMGEISELDKIVINELNLNETLRILEVYLSQHVNEFKGFKSLIN